MVRFETGRLAKQAAGSAMAYLDGETAVLSATTVGRQPKDQFDFFPLTVDVEERQYAAGKIPGSFFRREGRAGTSAILACRLIDRPLRPSFVKGLRNEVQVVETVLAIHPDDDYDVLAINAASMSTQIAGLPFSGPVAGTRIALVNGSWVAFPRYSEQQQATFQMVVAGRVLDSGDVAIMMVEAGATENAWDLIRAGSVAPTEEVVAEGLEAAKPHIKALCEAQGEVAAHASKPTAEFPLYLDYTDEQYDAVEKAAQARGLAAALATEGKQARDEAVDTVREQVLAEVGESFPAEEDLKALKAAFRSVTKKIVRHRTLTEGVRMDGRGLKDIRTLAAEVEVLPRVHGSAVFERGRPRSWGDHAQHAAHGAAGGRPLARDPQALHAQLQLSPFSTGETGRVGAPKRREIGHGNLAERALVPVLPSREDFPYAIRQVSEALGSNGSTSMGSVCASTLSLLNAGVPLRAPVAGIAMGLMHEVIDGETRWATLTDILGSEDAFGDMDFKVAGTRDFITALQLDTKLDGLPSEVLAGALGQARDARLFILDVLAQAIDAPDEMAPTAPRVLTVQIPVDKIGEVIGPKGKMINQIQEDTGADLTVEDDGTVYIGAADGPSAEAAREAVNAIANPQMPEIGERFVGTVVKTTTFGAFVSLTPGKDGLLHVSQIRRLVGGKRVENVEDVLNVGDKVQVELAEIDQRGKLSLNAVLTDEQLAAEAENEAARKAVSHSEHWGRRDHDGDGQRRERRPRRRRTRAVDYSEDE
ncbi:polyribonucleotide nucleotidyltransferase [Actinomyces lilanjuaniae]|uniref:polyribonucleotide nucleotidyltransferase n=1 Tax=Actinomyces lilanjuaniae TaxID=2321394 RepID=UPI001FA99CB0|nr:polyribonucleotide nucleotidyltransferase [Actinomyces lilanjuaniae]